MFEHTLAKRRGSRRRGWALALAVAVHGVGLTTVVLASVWSVGEVAPPLENDVYYPPVDVTRLVFEQPQREPAAPPPETRPPAPPVNREPAAEQPAPQVVQPETVPEAVAPATTGPELEPTTNVGGDTPASVPADGGGGSDPNAPPWSPGGGDGEVAQALDARMTPPETIFRITPRYTESARKAGRQGIVVLRATIDRTGAVTDVRLVKPLGLGLDESAISAVRQWRFTPATLQGRPVPVFFQLTVTFSIR